MGTTGTRPAPWTPQHLLTASLRSHARLLVLLLLAFLLSQCLARPSKPRGRCPARHVRLVRAWSTSTIVTRETTAYPIFASGNAKEPCAVRSALSSSRPSH